MFVNETIILQIRALTSGFVGRKLNVLLYFLYQADKSDVEIAFKLVISLIAICVLVSSWKIEKREHN
jgi:hypothetical protein